MEGDDVLPFVIDFNNLAFVGCKKNDTDLMTNEKVTASGQGTQKQKDQEAKAIAKLVKFKDVSAESMIDSYEDYKHFFDEYEPKLVSYFS